MPNENTDEEVRRAKNAVALIATKYQSYLMGNKELLRLMGMPSSGKLNTVINFMNAAPFAIENMRGNSTRNRPRAGCATAGFTRVLYDGSVIYINRQHVTPATIIHELLHFLTHEGFYARFGSQTRVVEGMTEHFTRAVQGQTSATDNQEAFRQFCRQFSPRTGHYPAETRAINVIDKSKLASAASMGFVLEKAFFSGNQAALEALALALDRPDSFERM